MQFALQYNVLVDSSGCKLERFILMVLLNYVEVYELQFIEAFDVKDWFGYSGRWVVMRMCIMSVKARHL